MERLIVMIPGTRTALRTALVGLLGVTAIVPMMTPSPASAQSGSRLCGTVFSADHTWEFPPNSALFKREVVVRLYEVPKSDGGPVCAKARQVHRDAGGGPDVSPADAPFADKIHDQTPPPFAGADKFDGWGRNSFGPEICESWRSRKADIGGQGDRDILPFGGGFDPRIDHFDICANMNRSDTLFEMQQYWLYWDGVPGHDVHLWRS